MKTKRMIATTWITLASLTLLASAGEPGYKITRQTIDGGGVMRSAGGEFELSGTLGQHDASVMTGGAFELAGGFWNGQSDTDCNEDGLVSILDHKAFVSCLLGPNGGIATGACPCFDVDRDADITLSDYAKLQAGFTGQ